MAFEDKYRYIYKENKYKTHKSAWRRDVAKIYRDHKKLHGDKALSIHEIYRRIHRGWEISDVILTPHLGRGGDRQTVKYVTNK